MFELDKSPDKNLDQADLNQFFLYCEQSILNGDHAQQADDRVKKEI